MPSAFIGDRLPRALLGIEQRARIVQSLDDADDVDRAQISTFAVHGRQGEGRQGLG